MLKGIDVYTGQGDIDWQAVRNSGVDFAMIKASQGRSERHPNDYLFPDPRFSANIQRAYDAGILCGVYHYLTAQTLDGADTEAQLFIDTIQPYRSLISLYAAVDAESKYIKNLPMQELTGIVNRFYDAVEAAGYRAMIYTNPDWLRYRLGDIGDKRLWLALWRNKDNVPSGYGNMKIWQYGDSIVDGIAEKVDSDFGYFDDDMFKESEEAPAMNETAEKDNTPAEWAQDAVQWAADNGILYGDENGDYKLHDTCTREQMLVFMHRLYKLINGG